MGVALCEEKACNFRLCAYASDEATVDALIVRKLSSFTLSAAKNDDATGRYIDDGCESATGCTYTASITYDTCNLSDSGQQHLKPCTTPYLCLYHTSDPNFMLFDAQVEVTSWDWQLPDADTKTTHSLEVEFSSALDVERVVNEAAV